MIRMEHVTKSFTAGKHSITAVSDVSLYIPKSRLVYLTGKNGAGKTTLILLMSGLLSPTSGRVYIDGQDISRLPERFLVNLRRNKIGMIFQERFLMPGASVLENLILPLIPGPMSGKKMEAKADGLLTEFGLSEKKHIHCRYLSGGEKQRLMIARALINDPDILFADEPFTHLDQEILALFLNKVTEWVASQKTVVLTSHQEEIAALDIPYLKFNINNGVCTEPAS